VKVIKEAVAAPGDRALRLLAPQWVVMSEEQRQQAISALAELLMPLLESERQPRAA